MCGNVRMHEIFGEIAKAYDVHRKRVMEKYGLLAIEVDVLMFLANNPDSDTAADIVRIRRISKSHVSLAVNSLETKGYLQRKTAPGNKKMVQLLPTEQAQDVVAFGRAQQMEFRDAMFFGFTDEEKQAFVGFYKRVYENIKKGQVNT